MEAAMAGAGEASAVQNGETAQQAEGAEETQGQQVDIGGWQESVDTRLGEAADSIRQMAELVQTRLPEPQAEPEVNFEDQFAQLFGDDAGLTGIDPSELQGLVQQQAEAIAQKMIAPLQQQFEGIQSQMTAQELGKLQTQFPELADAKVADQLAENVVGRAEEWGVPHLANNAAFVRMVHLAEKAQERAQQETPAGQGPVPQIETGASSVPASSEGDEWDKIANSGRPNGPIW